MKFWKPFFTVMIILVPSLYFGYEGKAAEMGIALAAGALAAAFLNLDKLQSFKGAGIEIELKKAVEEAYATIESLKNVAEPLFLTAITNLTYGKRLSGIPQEQERHLITSMEEVIKTTNLVNPDLDNAIKEFYIHETWDRFSKLIDIVRKNNVSVSDKLKELVDRKETSYPSEERINQILGEVPEEIALSVKEAINNYVYYKENQKDR
ncbi:hypothetical protein A3844_01705 [Paenibacillus helianthi]|uniref:Uncharacterized protein n=1 Tax=Paenibacillus helianthi TaxID=1349432 RepID=A0ABX3EYE8_9BACL|nr:hypothetical protein [Paenibacillus helianthi]OKP91855.1 hypothetical protein A3844_01705 [Paenibacillus helianthi]